MTVGWLVHCEPLSFVIVQDLLAKGKISADDVKAASKAKIEAKDKGNLEQTGKQQMAPKRKDMSSSSKKGEEKTKSDRELSPTSQMRRVAEKYPEACGCGG